MSKPSNRIVRLMFRPFPWIIGLRGEKAEAEVSRLLSVEGTDPAERKCGAEYGTHWMGFLIGLTMAIFALLGWATNNPSFALQCVTAPLIFFSSACVVSWTRTLPATRDLNRWNEMKSLGQEDAYLPDEDSHDSIPTDRDLLPPLVLTLVLTPIILVSGIFQY